MDILPIASVVDGAKASSASDTIDRKGGMIDPSHHNASPSGTLLLSKGQSYRQLRNVSSSSSPTAHLANSPPPSPTSTPSSRLTNITVGLSPKSMPRASSIESAISNISTATAHSHKSSQDAPNAKSADISHLIQTAGSPEAVIHHLLREKQQSAAQNAQLWRLVDKQRALLFGLNQDLENAVKDKERYRKKLKEHLARTSEDLGEAKIPGPRAASQSPTTGDSNTERPARGTYGQAPHPQRSVDSGPVLPEPRQTQSTSTGAGFAGGELPSGNREMRDKSPSAERIAPMHGSLIPHIHCESPNDPNRSQAPLGTAVNLSHHDEHEPNPVVSPSSFTAKRLQPLWQKTPPSSPPKSAATSGTFSPLRKLPPAPLDLRARDRTTPPPPLSGPEDHSGSEYGVQEDEPAPPVERGRKKTREEDDKEREAAALKEQQDRSRSKKEKGSKTPSEAKTGEHAPPVLPLAAPIRSTVKAFLPESNSGVRHFLSAPTSLAGMLTATGAGPQATVRGTVLSVPPLSPGLPLSPRPGDRPMNSPLPRMPRDGTASSLASPPLTPRPGLVGLPLSPKVAKQFSSLAPRMPLSPTLSLIQSSHEPESEPQHLGEALGESGNLFSQEIHTQPESFKIHSPGSSRSKTLFNGFVSEAYPGLLIPPNALPSITIKVTSSWLKPSRNSYLVSKGLEEEPVFALGVFARSDHQGLWQVEKSLMSLPQLDHQIKQHCTCTAKLPDRSLLSGQAPAKIDARKIALESYFETILETPMNEKAALVLCHYLSTQVIDPDKEESYGTASASGSPVTVQSEGMLTKEGYLTKRGKNFGGWKARFFVLDDPIMRYYESPGGSLLGTIKLHHAKIGKPSARHASTVPAEGTEEHDSQYRHAFLILEPKRKDSSSHVRHVLCAESDAERDAWVETLLCYVDGNQETLESKKPSFSSNDSGSKIILPPKPPFPKDGSLGNSPESETFDGTPALNQDDTQPSGFPPGPYNVDHPSPPNMGKHSQTSISISAPSNGAKIEDVGAWGNKPLAAPSSKDKDHKKRSIWGFREKHSVDLAAIHPNDSSFSLTQQQYYEQIANVRPVFGMPLAEAVECCAPRLTDVCLPAVVYRCLEYLVAKGASKEEGIFRLSGSSLVIKGLRDRFNLEGDLDFLADDQYYDVHAVASLLKLYLRELPTSVLTRELHLDFLAVLCKLLVHPYLSFRD